MSTEDDSIIAYGGMIVLLLVGCPIMAVVVVSNLRSDIGTLKIEAVDRGYAEYVIDMSDEERQTVRWRWKK